MMNEDEIAYFGSGFENEDPEKLAREDKEHKEKVVRKTRPSVKPVRRITCSLHLLRLIFSLFCLETGTEKETETERI